MISCCWKHPNVYMAGDAYAPKHWPASVVHFANTFGQDKFLFGTDFSEYAAFMVIFFVGVLWVGTG